MTEHPELNRRLLLAGASCSALALPLAKSRNLVAAETFQRSGGPKFRLSLAAYSLRKYFAFMKGKSQKPADEKQAINMSDFIDYCAKLDIDGAELTSYFFPPEIDDAYLLRLKRYAFLQGITISGTAIGNNFTCGAGEQLDSEIQSAMNWIDRASVLGAPHIRFFAGTGKQLDDHPERMQEAVEAMRRCADHAASKGIFLGIENHGNLRREQLLDLMKAVDHPWVGINLDTGNFFSEDPYSDLEACVSLAVNVQVKTTMRKPNRDTYKADLPRVVEILRKGNYRGSVVLEFEEEEPFDGIPQTISELKRLIG
ncbi:MAG: sugar phosphate isomerase/epimerase family protein [Planctomycetota bacterium]